MLVPALFALHPPLGRAARRPPCAQGQARSVTGPRDDPGRPSRSVARSRALGTPGRRPAAAVADRRRDRDGAAGRPGAGHAHLAGQRRRRGRRDSLCVQSFDLDRRGVRAGRQHARCCSSPTATVVGDAGMRPAGREPRGRSDIVNVSPADGLAGRRDRTGHGRVRAARQRRAAWPGRSPTCGPSCPTGVELDRARPCCSATSSTSSATRIWLVIGFVVGISVLLLMVMFRSVLIPLKAAVMNLLSVTAAYGVLTAVFQWGWGQELLGLDHAVPVSTLAADPDVRHPVRPVDGLRGVPALADPRGLRAHRRRPRQRGPRPGVDQPGDHRRGGDHGGGLPRVRRPRTAW